MKWLEKMKQQTKLYLLDLYVKNQFTDKHHLEEKLADLLLAVNRAYNKSDYIPTIAWEEMQVLPKLRSWSSSKNHRKSSIKTI